VLPFFYSYYFLVFISRARIPNRKSAPSRRPLKLLTLESGPPLPRGRCNAIAHTWPGKAVIYKYSGAIFHLQSASFIKRARAIVNLVDKWKTDVSSRWRRRRSEAFFRLWHVRRSLKRRLIAALIRRAIFRASWRGDLSRLLFPGARLHYSRAVISDIAAGFSNEVTNEFTATKFPPAVFILPRDLAKWRYPAADFRNGSN